MRVNVKFAYPCVRPSFHLETADFGLNYVYIAIRAGAFEEIERFPYVILLSTRLSRGNLSLI